MDLSLPAWERLSDKVCYIAPWIALPCIGRDDLIARLMVMR